MKPIKPKPMPKALEKFLIEAVEVNAGCGNIDAKDARSILAALEYERQRWQESQEKLAERNIGLLALARKYGWPDVDNEIASARWPQSAVDIIAEDSKAEVMSRMTPAQQRAETAAVIPKPRKKLTAP